MTIYKRRQARTWPAWLYVGVVLALIVVAFAIGYARIG